MASVIRGIPQVCPACGWLFPSTVQQDAEIKRGWLGAEDVCPQGPHYREEDDED